MKQLFIAFLIVLGLSACTNPEEAIKAYQQQKEAIGLQTFVSYFCLFTESS